MTAEYFPPKHGVAGYDRKQHEREDGWPIRQFNEPMLAALLASLSLIEVMDRFGISAKKLAGLRQRFDL